jgi:hypothetical protein
MALFGIFTGRAGGDPQFAAVNGTVNAAADHELGASSAFPNFRTGAVDNYYPLSHAHVDSSPFAEGTASPADTGPLGQTGASQATVSQPQYADVRYPPGGPARTVGSPGGPYATASAQLNSGSASATAGGEVPAQAQATRWSGLFRALDSWRQQFLTADDAARFPPPRAASTPDGSDGDTSLAQVTFDPKGGVLTDVGDARVQRASYGGGAISIRNVHVRVQLPNNGTPTATIVIDGGNVSVGGVPVVVGQNGVSVANQQVPGIGQDLQSANAALNQTLAASGVSVHTVAPQVDKSANQETVDAEGIEVDINQPSTLPGVPRQTIRHILGEVFADSLATPGTPPGETPPAATTGPPSPATTPGATPAPSMSSSGSVTSYVVPGTSAAPTASSGGTAPSFLRVAAHKPLWLLLLYFCWQAILIGTIASLWWWRSAAPAGSHT